MCSSDLARAVSEYKPGKKVDPAKYDFPDVTDGVRGMAFVESVVKSSKSSSKWTKRLCSACTYRTMG